MPEKTGCKCGTVYREVGDKWVVIIRRDPPKSCRLKCLRCGWKWWTLRKYNARLKDHVEDCRSGMTDQDILDRIMEGSLYVQDEIAYSTKQGDPRPLRIIERTSNGTTYRFVELSHKGKKKKIALHRLVWMYHNEALVPEGYDVDHRRGNRIPRPDRIDNLRLLESSINRSIQDTQHDDEF